MKLFTGAITALITPFTRGEVDFQSLENLLEQQMAGGIKGLVVNGTTAESPTLSAEEVAAVLQRTKNVVGTRVPIILGTGSNSTKKTIELTAWAREKECDGALVVTPYYNKPSQRGLVAHFKAVAEANPKLPILLYNVPARTVTNIERDTVLELSRVENIVGIKEASGDLLAGASMIKGTDPNFCVTSGDDGTFMDLMDAGGGGVISVISNFVPALVDRICQAKLSGGEVAAADIATANKIVSALSFEGNPVPIKACLQKTGVIKSRELRLPMVEASEEQVNKMNEQLAGLELK